jgi:polyisoprenoid-binding protein YceI
MSSTAVEVPGYGELALAPDPRDSSVTATIELASTSIRHSEDGFDIDGELTLHGVTRPVTLALDVNGFTLDLYGGTRAGFSATTELNRGDFGISTNIPMDGGGVVEIEAVLNPPQPASP